MNVNKKYEIIYFQFDNNLILAEHVVEDFFLGENTHTKKSFDSMKIAQKLFNFSP